MSKFLPILLFTCLKLTLFGANTDTIYFDGNVGIPIADKVFLYKDTNAKLKFKDVSNRAFLHNFYKSTSESPSFKSSKSALWVHFNLHTQTIPAVLMLDYPMLDTVQFYCVNSSGAVDSFYTGSAFAYKQRQVDYNRILFKINNEKTSVFLRIKSQLNLQLPITLFSQAGLNKRIGKENFYQGVYFGFVFLIIALNIVFFISSREKIYLYYVAHVAVTGFLMAHLNGYAFETVWPDMPYLNTLEPSIFGLTVFSILFSMQFLDIKNSAPRLYPWFIGSIVLMLVAFPLNLFGYGSLAEDLVQFATVFSCLLMLNAGMFLLRKGYKPARLFVAAWSFFLLGIIITVMQRFGFLPYKWYYYYAWQIGSVIDISMLSLALTDRINLLREHAENVRRQLLESTLLNEALIRGQNEKLANRVAERTAQLEDKNTELEKLNATKDKLFSIVAHDLKGPIGNIHRFLELMLEDTSLRDDDTVELLRKSSANTYNLLENLLTWARSQKGEIDYKPTMLNLKEISNYSDELMSLQFKNKYIEFKNTIANDVFVFADEAILRTIFRNLLSNAIKFSQPNGTILYTAEVLDDKFVKVSVKDSGVGIEADRLDIIFEPDKNKNTVGTKGEKGTGLGLLITYEFVELLKGKISVESEVNEGTTISFTLPLSNN
jgi:two-component system, sensor histidine kinase LadS